MSEAQNMNKYIISNWCSLFASGPTAYHQAYAHHGYYPMQQVHPGPGPHPQGVTYSPYPQRESYSQGSMYSSNPPPSYHRSYTPTSSRSDRSRKSNESSVKYTHSHSVVGEKVALPVNV